MTYLKSDARLSPCLNYRYSLTRVWDDSKDRVCWVCLNPSTADASQDDLTVTKIVGFSKLFGYAGFELVNLFSKRSTQPGELLKPGDHVGPEGDASLWAAASSLPLILAWGSWGHKFPERVTEVLRMLQLGTGKMPVHCLGITKDGHPKHPCRLAYNTPLVVFPLPGEQPDDHHSDVGDDPLGL